MIKRVCKLIKKRDKRGKLLTDYHGWLIIGAALLIIVLIAMIVVFWQRIEAIAQYVFRR